MNTLVAVTLAKSNLRWLKDHVLYVTQHGSKAYGTNIATSDDDYRGVCAVPREYVFGAKKNFEQAQFKDPDMEIYELSRFVRLASDCNPNILELLWTDPSDHVVMTPFFEALIDKRKLFLSKKVFHTFTGYAHGQLKRLSNHYRWLKNPPKVPPTRAECGLPEKLPISKDQLDAAKDAIQKQLDTWSFRHLEDVTPDVKTGIVNSMAEMLAEMKMGADEKYLSAGRLLGYSDNFLDLLAKERAYKTKQDDWKSFLRWKDERNEKRSELEAKFGYDTKHAMHLVRLMRMSKEILTEGVVKVRRPDAEELKAIRFGSLTYEALMDWAKKTDEELKVLVNESTLPYSVDREAIENLCVELKERSLTTSIAATQRWK